MIPAKSASSLSVNGGAGNDALDIILSDAVSAQLENTVPLMTLSSCLADPTGTSLDIGSGVFSLNANGIESARINHDLPFTNNRLKLNSVAASASYNASTSVLECLSLDVGGVAKVPAPFILKSTSDASTVDGNVISDPHATEVRGIIASTLHSASDLCVASSLQSIVTGSAVSTSGIALANALVDLITQLAPRRPPRLYRLVHRYQRNHGAQRHPVPERPLAAKLPTALRHRGAM